MFITPCFIRKNTPGLRENLEKLGYKICPCALFYDACWLDTNLDTVHGIGYSDETYPLPQEEQLKRFLAENEISNTPLIDCSDNEAMFLALAALRDDSDSHQYFIFTKDVQMGPASHKEGDLFYSDSIKKVPLFHLRKATADDIIERFTTKGGVE